MPEVQLTNLFFTFVEFPYEANDLFRETGQRVVFKGIAKGSELEDNLIIKLGTRMTSTDIARFERENRILEKLDSPFFPKIIKMQIFDRDDISGFYEKHSDLCDKTHRTFSNLFSGPFVVTAWHTAEQSYGV